MGPLQGMTYCNRSCLLISCQSRACYIWCIRTRLADCALTVLRSRCGLLTVSRIVRAGHTKGTLSSLLTKRLDFINAGRAQEFQQGTDDLSDDDFDPDGEIDDNTPGYRRRMQHLSE